MIDQLDRRISTRLDFDKTFYKELRKVLFRNGISLQEFFSYVIQLTVTGDERLHEILIELKKAQQNKEIKDEIVHTDAESLFNLIEGSSPFCTKGQVSL